MKKTFRIAGIVLGAILFTVGLGACSDDDDSALSGDKRLKSVVYTSADGRVEENTYEYDARGRVIKSSYSDSEGDNEIMTYTYDDTRITATNGVYFKEEYYITDGLVRRYVQYYNGKESHHDDYTYDKDRHLIGIESQGSDDEIEWTDGNLTAIKTDYDNTVYTYTDIPWMKGCTYYPNIAWEIYSQGYYGVQSENLVASQKRYGELVEYTYEIKDGYVVKRIGSDGMVVTFKWE